MKQIFTFLLGMLAAATATAGQVITLVVNNGNWGATSSWDLNRKPQNGDTIVIPGNNTILFNTDESLNGVVVKIYGIMNMNGGKKLDLDNASMIKVLPGGTIMGQGSSDQIRIGSTHVFNGSDPDVVGPMYADAATGAGFAPLQLLPVTFANFTVSKENGNIKISWSTATEKNNSHFEIEKSADGMNWSSIAIVAAAGNSNSISNYSFIDKKTSGSATYYRIKQVDENGQFTYTAVKSLKNDASTSSQIFSTGNKNITIQFDAPQAKVQIRICTLTGQTIMSKAYTESNYISVQLNNTLPGVYVVQVLDGNNNSASKKFFVN